MDGIIIQSNSIVVKDGKLLMMSNGEGVYTPGGIVFEGQDPEEVCKTSFEKAKIVKVLHPSIIWKDLGNEKFPIVSLNYLMEIEDV